jgi:hypothetical protein
MFQLGLKRSSESKRNNMAGCPKAKAAAAGKKKHQKRVASNPPSQTEPRETNSAAELVLLNKEKIVS